VQCGNQLLGYVAARFKIYKAAYEWVLANRIDPKLIEAFLDAALRGVRQ
jgi:hypothetical protein